MQAVSNLGLCSLHRLKMVAKLGSLTQRVQSLSSASTLVYSQLSLLQLSRAAASGQYIRTYAHLHMHGTPHYQCCWQHTCIHAYVHRCKLTWLMATWPSVCCSAHGTADLAVPCSYMLGRGSECSSNCTRASMQL